MKIYTLLLSIILIAVLFSVACGGNKPVPAGTQPDKSSINEGVMTTSVDDNSKPTSPVKTSFPADTPAIYCSFKVSGVTQEDLIKASWYYIKGEAVDKQNQLLDGGEMYTSGQADDKGYYLAFYEDMPAGGWYKGSYKVVLSVNGIEKLSVPFSVE